MPRQPNVKAFLDPGRLYNQQKLNALGIGRMVIQQARKDGLRPHRIGNTNWFRGDELIEWMKSQPRSQR